MTIIGVLSPGAMGAALARTWQRSGARVVTTTAGRSARTQQLAEGLELVDSIDEVVRAADLVVSVVPPARAVANAEQIAAAALRRQVRPVVADLNAISITTLEWINSVMTEAG